MVTDFATAERWRMQQKQKPKLRCESPDNNDRNKAMKTQRTMNHNTARIACLGFAGLLAAVSVLPAGAQSRYLITDLGTLPGLADSYVWADVGGGSPINNRGHVAVYANNTGNPYPVGGDSSFLWTGPGEMAPLPGLPGDRYGRDGDKRPGSDR